MMALGNHFLYEVKGFPMTLDDGLFIPKRITKRSMAAVVPLEHKHITSENFTNSNSTQISVIYKSHSIFEEATSSKTVV